MHWINWLQDATKPEKHKEIESRYSAFIKKLRDENDYVPQDMISEIRPLIQSQRKSYRNGMLNSTVILALGIGAALSDVYFDTKLREYVWYLPEVVGAAGLANLGRNFGLYLDTLSYESEVNSAINDFILSSDKIKRI